MKIKYILFIIIGIAVLGVTYYGISPLFRNIELNEVDPSLIEPSKARPTPKTEIPAPGTILSAPVMGTLGHPASGAARIVESNEKTYLRYENFKTINGPDLFVYLSKDMRASEFVNLGQLKATEGNVNYEIPAGINIKDYPYALVWCRAFSVLFNSADLHSIQ